MTNLDLVDSLRPKLTTKDVRDIKRECRKWNSETSPNGRYYYEVALRLDKATDDDTFVANRWETEAFLCDTLCLDDMRKQIPKFPDLRFEIWIYEARTPAMVARGDYGDLLDQHMVQLIPGTGWSGDPEHVRQTF